MTRDIPDLRLTHGVHGNPPLPVVRTCGQCVRLVLCWPNGTWGRCLAAMKRTDNEACTCFEPYPELPVVHSPSEIAEAIIKHAEEREGELLSGARDELAVVREALERMERR